MVTSSTRLVRLSGVTAGASVVLFSTGSPLAFLLLAVIALALVPAVRWAHNNAIALDKARLSKTVREIVRDTKLYETQDRRDAK